MTFEVCPVRPATPSFVRTLTTLAVLLVCAWPAPVLAQGDDAKHFGVSVSFSPYWKSRNDLLFTMGLEDRGTFEGSEFTVGMVRGRTFGGEWGVSFVRKPFKDTTTVTEETNSDSGQCGTGCSFSFTNTTTRTTTLHDVYVQGIEVHWAPSFVTISNRVQIGMNIAGGIAVPKGTIEETIESVSMNTNTFNGQTTTNTNTFSDSDSLPANEVMYGKVPLFKVEAQGAVILAPGLKVKVSGGLNNPGIGIRIGAVYLFGAN
jgi:hypothetical protein